jgi:hypothetical protein
MRKLNWGLILCIAFCVGFWLTVGVIAAKGAYTDQALNDVATKIAGHPVSVSCASSGHEWVTYEDSAFPGQNFEADGFTFIGRTPSVIYLAPRICDTLEADLHGNPAGDYWNGLAIKVLLHESSHQAGIADEHAAECNALSLLKTYAPIFGYPAKVSQVSYVKVRDGHFKRVTKQVANPALKRLAFYAEFWHRALPAPYSAAC